MANRLPKVPGNISKLGRDPKAELERAYALVREDHRPRHAVLDEDGNPVPADLFEWARFFEHNPQRITWQTEMGDHQVSTVFLGLDMNLSPMRNAVPLWFETMCFGPPQEADLNGRKMMVRPSLWETRTTTKDQAIAAHEEGIKWLTTYLAKCE